MLGDYLYHPDDEHMPLDEAIGRIARNFRRVIVDWLRGDAEVQRRIDHLIARKADAEIIGHVQSLMGATAWARKGVRNRSRSRKGWVRFLTPFLGRFLTPFLGPFLGAPFLGSP